MTDQILVSFIVENMAGLFWFISLNDCSHWFGIYAKYFTNKQEL